MQPLRLPRRARICECAPWTCWEELLQNQSRSFSMNQYTNHLHLHCPRGARGPRLLLFDSGLGRPQKESNTIPLSLTLDQGVLSLFTHSNGRLSLQQTNMIRIHLPHDLHSSIPLGIASSPLHHHPFRRHHLFQRPPRARATRSNLPWQHSRARRS